MRRSTDWILTTHVGSLQRPAALSKALAERGQWDPGVLDQLRGAVADVVRRQEETGLDIVNDGEFGKTMWSRYALDRLDGIDATLAGNRAAQAKTGLDQEDPTDQLNDQKRRPERLGGSRISSVS